MMKGKKVELPSGCYGSEMSAQSVHHLSASSRAYSTFFSTDYNKRSNCVSLAVERLSCVCAIYYTHLDIRSNFESNANFSLPSFECASC